MLLNTLSGNSTQREHQFLVPPATCFPALTLVHSLVPCQGCAAHIALLAALLCCGAALFCIEYQTYSRLFCSMKNPWQLIPQTRAVITVRAYLPSYNCKKMFSISNKRGLVLTLKPWPCVLTSLPGCHRYQSTPSPRGEQLLNAPTADTGPYSWPKGHRSRRAVQTPTAARHAVTAQLICPLVLSLSSTRWK